MQTPGEKNSPRFPNPLESKETKSSNDYGARFAKAIMDQWGSLRDNNSLLSRRARVFDKNRKYANGTQDTTIYREILSSLDPSNQDGSLVSLDFSPVPILPKFVRIVENKILSKDPYPNLEAVDPLSSSEKDLQRKATEMAVKHKREMIAMAQQMGVDPGQFGEVPDTLEEAEIFMDNNIKSSSEIAAQITTNMTLEWNNFNDEVFPRYVADLVRIGMGVGHRINDPNYGITTNYIDPKYYVHSYTEDQGMNDLVYAGHVKNISIQELKRLAGNELSAPEYDEIARKAQNKYGYDSSRLTTTTSGSSIGSAKYDDYMVEVLCFEFKSVDTMFFESKESQYGNEGFYYKGYDYNAPENSVYKREVSEMQNETIYGGMYIVCSNQVISYGERTNIPKNVHDLSKAQLSYYSVAVNLHDMIPKSMVGGCISYADQINLTHLKIQQSIAKSKPDGIMIDIEGLEDVQLGKGGALDPLQIFDIYEQTGALFFRSKNVDGTYQAPPIKEISNQIRNIPELRGIYMHYLDMIRDTTGINEVMDGSTPKGDALVGVRQQAISAGNNATYDITNASMYLFKKVCRDIVKCIQIVPEGSILWEAYANAIGKTNIELLTSFKDLVMYNFGVTVQKEMEDVEKQYLEQNIQISLSSGELDIEDAIAIRGLKDVNQAERLLVVRRKKRIAARQQEAEHNSKIQAQVQAQSAMIATEGKMKEIQAKAQADMAINKQKSELKMGEINVEWQWRERIQLIETQGTLGFKQEDQEFKENLQVFNENRKDDRVKLQAKEQGKLINQRKGKESEEEPNIDGVVEDATKE